MGRYKAPLPVKLIVGFLAAEKDVLESARRVLSERFGAETEAMDPIPFIWTRYYADELGEFPWRAFASYETLIPRETIVDIKHYTNELESRFSRNGLRRVNLDPGYMTLGQFFLATTKDQRQRVYVREGIYVEPTLYFQDGVFRPFDWTYRDYRSEEYLAYFNKARAGLARR